MASSPARLAELHASAFDTPWSVEAFKDLLAETGVKAVESPHGFILIRTVADEAEILTLAVRPGARCRGEGRRLVEAAIWLCAEHGVGRLLLEVAEDNAAALALYAASGFVKVGRRTGYYVRSPRPAVDALILALDVPEQLA